MQGIRNKDDSDSWTTMQVRGIIKNPIYKGYMYRRVVSCTDYLTHKSVSIPEEEREYVKGNFPPIVLKSCGKNAEGAEQAADRENKDRQRRHTGMQEQRREINGLAACSAAAEPECIDNLRHPTAYAMGAAAQTRRQVLRWG